ncbi:MAG: type 1 glutamine amidotransferase [Pseudomonadota bacterium]
MRIGILKTGDLPEEMEARHGTYGDIFARFLTTADAGLKPFTIDVDGGETLPAPKSAEGWLITGSRHGVYEDHDWLPPLEEFVRAAIADRVPLVGICFGHQVMAQAMGGRVVKSEKGWGLGVHRYTAAGAQVDWIAGHGGEWNGYAVHQDQVIAPPPDAVTLAGSAFCPHAILAYGDAAAPVALSSQPHPEYSAPFLEDILDARLASAVPADIVSAARAGLDTPVAGAAWGRTIAGFFRSAAARRAQAA